MSFYLAIVSPTDSPLYQLSFSSSRPPAPSAASPSSSSFPSWSTFTAPNGADNTSAADGARAWKRSWKGQEHCISRTWTDITMKFILLHDIKNDDGIRTFFVELWESYIKVLMNPFHSVNTPITSPAFETRVKAIAKKHL
ncbi:hypothetical protein IAR50_005471 [Cryptococcus sp. DSM 104548]